MNQDDSDNAMCYVGLAPCGCYKYAAVDMPEIPEAKKLMAKDIARMIKDGWTIERKTVQWVRDGGLNFHCPHKVVEIKGQKLQLDLLGPK
jgi:hypothetical protein